MISKEIKKDFALVAENIKQVENFASEYDKRFCKQIIIKQVKNPAAELRGIKIQNLFVHYVDI
jgi:hypothetical protein